MSESWLTRYRIYAYLIRRSSGRCHRLYVLRLLSGRGRGRDGEGGRGTPELTLLTSIPPILIHHSILSYFPILTHHSILLYPIDLYITFHTPRHLHIFTISDVARASLHGSRYHLIIPYIVSHQMRPWLTLYQSWVHF